MVEASLTPLRGAGNTIKWSDVEAQAPRAG
jgi:hypothetical protein